MRKAEITKLAQEQVASLMADGFCIDLMELTGSYSDVEGTQAVFAKGNERVVMWCKSRNDYRAPESITLRMARFAVTAEKNLDWGFSWSSEWEPHVFFEATVWKVGDDWYTTDEAEATRCRELSIARYRSRYEDGGRKLELTDGLLSIVRRVKGFKSVRRDDICVTKKSGNRWEIRNTASGNRVVIDRHGKDRW